MQEIVKLYHTLPICALLSIKLHILHMIELFFQGDYFLENKLSSKGKDSLNNTTLQVFNKKCRMKHFGV